MKMNLKNLREKGKLKKHKTSRQEIKNLFKVVSRDIKDAKVDVLSDDRRFATAYNAALQCATAVVFCSGYRTHGAGHHFTVFEASKIIMGSGFEEVFDYFDSCRTKRNRTDYDMAGTVSKTEADELINESEKLSKDVRRWIKNNHPQYF